MKQPLLLVPFAVFWFDFILLLGRPSSAQDPQDFQQPNPLPQNNNTASVGGPKPKLRPNDSKFSTEKEKSAKGKNTKNLSNLTSDAAEEPNNDDDTDSHSDPDSYLYGEDSDPVIDYHSHGSLDPMHPDFLFSPNNGPRMVEFYAVWCPHCQHFKDHYVQIARQVQTIARDQNLGEIKVYGVACNLFKDICRHYDIDGYPQIRLFKANSTEVAAKINYWEIHAFDVLQSLGVQPQLDSAQKKLDAVAADTKNNGKNKKIGDSNHARGRSQEDIFNDAYLSFDFSLRNGIYMHKGPLSNKTALVFEEWLQLLKHSMPPAWKIQPVISGLLKHFNKIIQSEKDLLEVLDRYPPPPSKKWSYSCTHGIKGAGYTCGLWQLFHIMTVGVVEWNLMIYDGDSLILATEECAQTLRNFVENFFGCNVCRMNFVNAFDACSFGRCNRLRPPDDPDAQQTQEEWIELPLWLFETHNAVNLRLMKERAEREHTKWNHQDEVNTQWPSAKDCPRCWRKDGAWDEQMVYKYLRTEYWPNDAVSDIYRVALEAPMEPTDDDLVQRPGGKVHTTFLVILPLGVLIGFGATWYMKEQERRRSGWHKRIE